MDAKCRFSRLADGLPRVAGPREGCDETQRRAPVPTNAAASKPIIDQDNRPDDAPSTNRASTPARMRLVHYRRKHVRVMAIFYGSILSCCERDGHDSGTVLSTEWTRRRRAGRRFFS